jgi:hypothetical protein
MNTEKLKFNAVWNADDSLWVVLRDDQEEMITASTIMGLSKKLDNFEFFPVQIRYPGNTELVDGIH